MKLSNPNVRSKRFLQRAKVLLSTDFIPLIVSLIQKNNKVNSFVKVYYAVFGQNNKSLKTCKFCFTLTIKGIWTKRLRLVLLKAYFLKGDTLSEQVPFYYG